MRTTLGLFVLAAAAFAQGRTDLLTFTIKLDDAPEVRFKEVNTHFNKTINDFASQWLKETLVMDIINDLAKARGPETDEYQAELNGIASVTGVSVKALQVMGLAYELSEMIMPAIENLTHFDVDLSSAAEYGIRSLEGLTKAQWPFSGPGCTGIIGTCADGTVNHVRNLDFSPGPFMQSVVYDGRFTRGGKEVFRAQMMAGYSNIVTGMRMGPDGWTYETNTRFPAANGGNKVVFHNLFKEKRLLNGWIVRKTLESAATYDAAVAAISTTPWTAPMYCIISGVKKGTILARDPDGVAHQMVLGQKNFECRADYIIMTNFDYFWHDLREWFDPTGEQGHGLGKPRRLAAQKVLNASVPLTADVMWSAINNLGDMAADTIFQALMNVELGVWNVSKPQLPV